jgi:tRNA A37 methylthiotransferase MiaB
MKVKVLGCFMNNSKSVTMKSSLKEERNARELDDQMKERN